MAKRKAVTDLNHENWDSEEKPETAGKFQQAPKEVLQTRVIRTAKRRLHKSDTPSAGGGCNNEQKKLFSGFNGFGNIKSTVNPSSVSENTKNSFSFLQKCDPPEKKESTDNIMEDDKPVSP